MPLEVEITSTAICAGASLGGVHGVLRTQTFGDNACHPERSEGSGSTGGEILRCAQDDSQDTTQVRSREVLSPNVCCELSSNCRKVRNSVEYL
jgi:hypothetical protein